MGKPKANPQSICYNCNLLSKHFVNSKLLAAAAAAATASLHRQYQSMIDFVCRFLLRYFIVAEGFKGEDYRELINFTLRKTLFVYYYSD